MNEVTNLFNLINGATDVTSKFIWSLQLTINCLIIFVIIGNITLMFYTLYVFIRLSENNGFTDLTQGEKRIKERLEDPNCHRNINPEVKTRKFFFSSFVEVVITGAVQLVVDVVVDETVANAEELIEALFHRAVVGVSAQMPLAEESSSIACFL